MHHCRPRTSPPVFTPAVKRVRLRKTSPRCIGVVALRHLPGLASPNTRTYGFRRESSFWHCTDDCARFAADKHSSPCLLPYLLLIPPLTCTETRQSCSKPRRLSMAYWTKASVWLDVVNKYQYVCPLITLAGWPACHEASERQPHNSTCVEAISVASDVRIALVGPWIFFFIYRVYFFQDSEVRLAQKIATVSI